MSDDDPHGLLHEFVHYLKQIGLFFLPIVCLSVIIQFDSIPLGWKILIGITCIVIQYKLVLRILPSISDAIIKMFYSAYGCDSEPETITQARQLMAQGNKKGALDLFEAYRRENGKVIRTWVQEASFLLDIGEYIKAIDVLNEGLNSRRFWSRENKALFLYKIGSIYINHLRQVDKCIEYYQTAATKYPKTSYGAAARQQLAKLSHF